MRSTALNIGHCSLSLRATLRHRNLPIPETNLEKLTDSSFYVVKQSSRSSSRRRSIPAKSLIHPSPALPKESPRFHHPSLVSNSPPNPSSWSQVPKSSDVPA
jgi:hypothetical protein